MIELDDLSDLDYDEFDDCIIGGVDIQLVIPNEEIDVCKDYFNKAFEKDLLEGYRRHRDELWSKHSNGKLRENKILHRGGRL